MANDPQEKTKTTNTHSAHESFFHVRNAKKAHEILQEQVLPLLAPEHYLKYKEGSGNVGHSRYYPTYVEPILTLEPFSEELRAHILRFADYLSTQPPQATALAVVDIMIAVGHQPDRALLAAGALSGALCLFNDKKEKE